MSGVTLITGGCGFVGTNLADRLLRSGRRVRVFDNLSRAGVEKNLRWLQAQHPRGLEVEVADIRDQDRLHEAVRGVDSVFHFAAQVAVTTSLEDPESDFEINARGTLNLLQAIRRAPNPPFLLFTSTNKVYGGLEDVRLRLNDSRYEPVTAETRSRGIGEDRRLDFHSPYGCSKGAADQYVVDYARSYNLPAAVFRMSCIYGPHQFGTEDQGWVAHFLIRALEGQPITLYGDGKQVRDVLFVEDLVEAFLLAEQHQDRLSGRAFNIGGGPENTTSLLELVQAIGRLHGRRPRVRFDDWRPGDQRYYVSDTRLFSRETGWKASVPVQAGVTRLYEWLIASRPDLQLQLDEERDEVLAGAGR